MSIRPATAADIPAMLAIERRADLAAHWTAAEYERIFTPGQTPRLALVIEQGGEVLAFLIARTLGPDWELENIAVEAGARRRRRATRLVEQLLLVAREEGAGSVYLEVRESNRAARALYEKQGFVQTGRRKSYYNNPLEDAMVYQFRLAESR